MYTILHKHKSLTIAVITVATAGFFLWLFFAGGVSDIITPSKRCVAEVGDGCITLRDYRRELQRYANLLQNQEMERLIQDQVLSNLIGQELLYQKAKSLSLLASDEEVIEVIKLDPSFSEGGVFSASKYKEIISRNGMTPEEYEDYIKKMLTIQKLINLISNASYLSEKEREVNLLIHSTYLRGKLYLVTLSEVSLDYKPSERELVEYYQKNRELFKRPEEKRVLVWREKDKERALAIYKGLKEGRQEANYQEITIPRDREKLSKVLNAEIERLGQEGRTSMTKEGEEYIVLYLKEVLPAGYEDFEKVKEKVREKVLEEKSSSLLLERAKKVAEELKQGKSSELKALSFSDTPVSQLSAVARVDSKDLVKIVFSEDKVFGPYPLRQGYGVLLVEERAKKVLEKDEEKELIRDILSLKSEALLTDYIEHLRKKTKIVVNKELIGG